MKSFLFDLGKDRLARLDDPLLVDVSGRGVLFAEEVEVGFADHVRRALAMGLVFQETVAHQDEPATEVFEEHPFPGHG